MITGTAARSGLRCWAVFAVVIGAVAIAAVAIGEGIAG